MESCKHQPKETSQCTWIVKFLGVSFNHKKRTTSGRIFSVHSTAKNRGESLFYAMNGVDKICRFFTPRMEVAVVVSTQQVSPVIKPSEVMEIPEEWIEAFQSAETSDYVFSSKGEVIDNEKQENQFADGQPDRVDAVIEKPAEAKGSAGKGSTSRNGSTGRRRQGGGARRKSNAGHVGGSIPARKGKTKK